MLRCNSMIRHQVACYRVACYCGARHFVVRFSGVRCCVAAIAVPAYSQRDSAVALAAIELSDISSSVTAWPVVALPACAMLFIACPLKCDAIHCVPAVAFDCCVSMCCVVCCFVGPPLRHLLSLGLLLRCPLSRLLRCPRCAIPCCVARRFSAAWSAAAALQRSKEYRQSGQRDGGHAPLLRGRPSPFSL